MKVRPYDKTIQTLFDSGFYVIPRFQRPYSWEKEHISDFWVDIIENQDNDYFIGSMVLYSHKSEFMVVDGQQRLTTITILLCAIRDKFLELAENELAEGLQGVLERKDINAQVRYTLFSEAPYPFFQNHIQKMGKPDLKAKVGDEEAALKSAYDDLLSLLGDKLSSIDNDGTVSSDRRRSEKVNFLKLMRDKVLGLQVIVVELDNEDDAYLIFETLNTRGKATLTMMLLKKSGMKFLVL